MAATGHGQSPAADSGSGGRADPPSAHDPANRRNLAYLAASEGGQPILFNRLLTDADVVLPVGCMQREHSAGYFGIHTTIYPEYSDQHTQARFRKHDRFTGMDTIANCSTR